MNEYFTNLFELTHQESGIVIYGDEVIICNWSSYDDGKLPVIAPANCLVPFKVTEGQIEVIDTEELEDIKMELEGKDIIYDANDDTELIANGTIPGTMYTLTYGDRETIVKVIAPEDWN